MSQRKAFLLRVTPELYTALERWAQDELRSVNAQMEYLLTQAVRKSGRARVADAPPGVVHDPSPTDNDDPDSAPDATGIP